MGKVYICTTCCKEFTTSSNLARHVRKDHVVVAKTRSRSPVQLSEDSSNSSASVSSCDSDGDSENQGSTIDEDDLEADDEALNQESLQFLRHSLNMAEFGNLNLSVKGLLQIVDCLEPAEEKEDETDEEIEESEESEDSDAGSETSETSSAQGTDDNEELDFVLPQAAITMLQAVIMAASSYNLALSKNMLRDLVGAIHK
jgi:hypothetical protein